MSILERVSYLKGLTDGIGLDESTKEGKILKAIVDVLDDIALAIEDLDDGLDIVASHVEAMDDDLATLEEDFYDDFDFDYDDEDFELECEKCGAIINFEDLDYENEDLVCPSCGEIVTIECCFDDECDCHN